jgi:peptidoglycan hydrolase-like protein with peptidoglycan-binding domain
MARLLKKGNQTPEVKEVQTLLMDKGYLTDEEINSVFDNETLRAVRLFQSQNLDQNGQPLVVDGKVRGLTWWSLHHPKPIIQTHSAIDFSQMPSANMGGSACARAALTASIDELAKKAGEVGGNHRGPFVKRYLNGIVAEGNP